MLSQIVQSRPLNRKLENHQTCVNSRSRGRHFEPFTLMPESIDQTSIRRSQESTYRHLRRIIRLCGGECDWPVRRLAATCKMSVRQFQRDTKALRVMALLIINPRKVITCNRLNDTNLYRLPAGGGGVINVRGKQPEKYLKANTPAPPARGGVVSRERAENNPPAMAKLYHHNAVLQAENRSLRALVRGKDNNRLASDSYATLPKAEADKALREMEETLDRINPGWRVEVGYGL